MNHVITTKNTLAALDSISDQLIQAMNKKGLDACALAKIAGVDRKIIYPLLREPYKAPLFGNLIEILDAAGLKEVTIRW